MACHNKSANDFVFISSSSFLASAGHSSDGMNVGLWDTLLPPRSSLIQRESILLDLVTVNSNLWMINCFLLLACKANILQKSEVDIFA